MAFASSLVLGVDDSRVTRHNFIINTNRTRKDGFFKFYIYNEDSSIKKIIGLSFECELFEPEIASISIPLYGPLVLEQAVSSVHTKSKVK